MRPRLAAAVAAIAVVSVLSVTPTAAQDVAQVRVGADVSKGLLDNSSLAKPRILSDADAERYRRIFNVQEDGDWRRADALIGKLDDKLLLGHVLAQRYLHPTAYRSKYKELKDWLGEYADHPDAPRIYALARSRQPANWRGPQPPERVAVQQETAEWGSRGIQLPSRNLSKSERAVARSLRARIRHAINRGQTLVAKRLVQDDDTQRLLSTAEYDEARALLAKGYFIDGRDDWALDWVLPAVKRSGHMLPEANWIAGLTLWRAERYLDAARHFEAAANVDDQSEWMTTAAAFWAARGYLVAREPAKVVPLLEKAAAYPRTFYGLLAIRLMGKPLPFKWRLPDFKPGVFEQLVASPRGRRAVALLQVDEDRRSEREIAEIARGADRATLEGIHALAARGNMPGLAVRLDAQLFPAGGGYDSAAFPIPEFQPIEGFKVDRALVYALIRQESRFNPKAKSWAGARGLMQLMPGTARFVAQTTGMPLKDRGKLFLPETNLELGQRYLEILLDEKTIEGDLFRLAAAWNGGPGNVRKWHRNTKHLDDSLFFIESIPSRETRDFIERVLTNFWIYRHRLGQPLPSLDAVARGERPLYTALGHGDPEVAQHGPVE